MGFAALWILFFHEWQPVFGSYAKIAMLENFVKRIGFCGVDIFLFLSGIGMVYSYGKSDKLFLFYYKRIKRVILPFLLMAIVRCYRESWPIAEFWKNITGINFYLVNIYKFLWFVPMVMTFYIFFPLYYRFFVRSANKIIFTGCSLTLWLIWTLRVSAGLRGDLFGFTNRIPIFLIGILVGWISQRKEMVFDRLTWAFLVLVFILGIYLSYLSNYAGMYILVPVSNCCIPNILMAVSISFLFPLLLYGMSAWQPIRLIGMLLCHILSFYGLFTLELYCIQEWLGGQIIARMEGRYSPMTVNVVLWTTVTILAFLIKLIFDHFWMFFERIVQIIHRRKGA